MIKNKKLLALCVLLFLSLEAFFGYKLQVTGGDESSAYRYGAILLACVFCLAFASRSGSYAFTQFALICTAGADYFLVLHPDQRLFCMIFFAGTQTAYFLRLYFEEQNGRKRESHLTVRAALSFAVILVTCFVLGEATDGLALVSMFYYANLILNLIIAFIKFGRNPIFAVGLLLFILCDTVVGLQVLGEYLTIPADSVIYDIIYPGFDLAWTFYIPSQALLAISLLPERTKKGGLTMLHWGCNRG